ncbi:Predicted amidohydrolase [Balnearium lithotrophicum]|uniref:Predicted amidohydrolase n=1 Tax=Balnearium lithotrophicum TaxID=223788 RepID=A0A521ABC7_9BACT|nr:nitrilase-related carbon-nitrogen hydrolase [Balnearium lithotrophicum]SMO32061.1 Predicted amidohydrolase [Balnearium lithotrophicum]
MKVSLVQFSSKLGEFDYNLERTVEFAERARKEGSSICIFPELSLTGYNVWDLTFEVAIRLDSPKFSPLLELSREIDIVVGFVEESPEYVFYNSAVYLSDGKIKHLHRKVYLPTYGMFDEGRFFGRGNRVESFNSALGRSSILICEDLWHMSTVYLSFLQGVKFIFALSSSPGRGYKEERMFGNAEIWQNMGEFYSRMTGSYFFFVNRVGTEDGFVFSGKSFVSNPFGEIVAEASPFEEEILTVEVKEELVRSARIGLPLLRDERPEIVLEALRRLKDEI